MLLYLPLVAIAADAPPTLDLGDPQQEASHPELRVISEQAIASLIQNVTVSANVAGLVRSVPIVEGEVVGVGELLVQMNDSAAKADYQAAQKAASAAELKASNDVNLRYAQRTMEVSQAEYQKSEAANRRHAGAVSDTELARLKLVVDQGRLQMEQAEFEQRVAKAEAQEKASLANAAKIRLSEHAIQSPVGGMVAELLVQAGQHMDAGQPLVRLIDLKSLRVECLVSEELAGGLKSGMPVVFQFEQGKSVTGQVDFVSPEVHPVAHEVRITARVNNESLQLRPGTHGTLVLITAQE